MKRCANEIDDLGYESPYPLDKNGIWNLSNTNIEKIKFSIPYEIVYS